MEKATLVLSSLHFFFWICVLAPRNVCLSHRYITWNLSCSVGFTFLFSFGKMFTRIGDVCADELAGLMSSSLTR